MLSSLQNKLLQYENLILSEREFDEVNKELLSCFTDIDNIKMRLVNKKYDTENNLNNILLRGFVLCDFDEENQPYILSDLEPSKKNKMIDASIEPKKVKKGYEDFSRLINDLFMFGNTEKLDNNDGQGNTERVCDAVWYDPNERTKKTGMYRIKWDKVGVERFVEQRIVLHTGTVMYEQVINIIREIVPNVLFDSSMDVNLYINYASALKRDDKGLYNVAINRFDRRSPLYKLFNVPKNKTELSNEECELLKDIIHASLDAFSKLKDINPDVHVDVIKQIEEGRTRG